MSKKLIPKYQHPSGPIGLYLKPEDINKGLTKVSEWIVKGMAKVGEAINTAVTAGGYVDFDLTSPFANIDRRLLHKNQAKAVDKAKEKIAEHSVVVSPSSWIVGKGNPYRGAEIISLADPRLQVVALGTDIVTLAKAPKVVKTTKNAAVDVAAKAGSKTAKAKSVSRRFSENVETTKLELKTELTPLTRTRVGDVEIDNPQLAYRLIKSDGLKDFLETGVVRVPEGDYGKTSGRFNLGKSFDNPMFAQGKLWYGLPEESGSGLLVTSEPLGIATKSSELVSDIANGTFDLRDSRYGYNGRRVPLSEELLNLGNTVAYKWEPGYGYRLVIQEPSTSYAFTQRPRIGTPLKFGELTESKLLDRNNLGTYLGEGSEQTVYDAGNGFVHKVYDQGTFFNTLEDLLDFNKRFLRRNDFPLLVPIEYVGHLYLPRIGLPHQLVFYPVYRLKKITPNNLSWEELEPQVQLKLRELGYNDLKESGVFENEQHSLLDILPENIGFDNGLLRFIDVGVLPYKFGKILSTPTIQNRPAPIADPAIIRFTRLLNKKKAGMIPETDLTLIVRNGLDAAIIEQELVNAYKKLGIEEKDARDMARLTMKNNATGSHVPIASDEGQLIGGISYVDEQAASKMLEEAGIEHPTKLDINTIIGHEVGHQVEVPFSDKELYTKMGLILDNEGITAANPNITVEWLNDAFRRYLSLGRLDNGLSAIYEWFLDLPYNKALLFVENIKRYSMYTGAAYTLNNVLNKELLDLK